MKIIVLFKIKIAKCVGTSEMKSILSKRTYGTGEMNAHVHGYFFQKLKHFQILLITKINLSHHRRCNTVEFAMMKHDMTNLIFIWIKFRVKYFYAISNVREYTFIRTE